MTLFNLGGIVARKFGIFKLSDRISTDKFGTITINFPANFTPINLTAYGYANAYELLATDSFTVTSGAGDVGIVLVAGGGGGGFDVGGGGGAGGVVYSTAISVAPGITYTATIGAGGVPRNGPGSSVPHKGSDSTLTTPLITIATAEGGGGGGNYSAGDGSPGGSGGGGSGYGRGTIGGTGVPGQGNPGGDSAPGPTSYTGGGGGGYSSAGLDGDNTGNPTSVQGGTGFNELGLTSLARGGRGTGDSYPGPAAGAANTGDGGDGAGSTPSGGQPGGSGIFYIFY